MKGEFTKKSKWKIIKHLGVVSTDERTGWNRELNIVSWNGRIKLDIRYWDKEHEHQTTAFKNGACRFTMDEMQKIADFFNHWRLTNPEEAISLHDVML